MLILVLASAIYLYYPFVLNYSAMPKWVLISFLGISFFFIGNSKIRWTPSLTIWLLFILQFLISSLWSFNGWEAIVHSLPWLLAPISVLIIMANAGDFGTFYRHLALISR